MSERRRFNGRERVALYLAQDGKCALCGVELSQSWHGDHIEPWSRGGVTDVINGQALCPACNLKKGNSMAKKIQKDRRWQTLAWSQYVADSMGNWLLEVCPAGGKTYWALRVMSILLRAGIIERIVVVVPTDYLRQQWIKEAHKYGIELADVPNGESVLNGGMENRQDFQGIALTYAQVATGIGTEIHRLACSKCKTLVIFDESHHAGDSKTWGQAIEYAFEPAVRRISMTGTPWRRPKHGKIPFVTYDGEGRVIPNYRYTMAEGIRHGYVRQVYSHAFDGTLTYKRLDIDSCVPQQEIVRLGEVEDDDSKALQDILDVGGIWLPSIFRTANEKLLQICKGDEDDPAIPYAQGIVNVHDRSQARKAAKLIEKITGERCGLAISNPEEGDPNPQIELDKFKKGEYRWIVAVDMISEGFDNPNIFVIVYATRKKTPLRVRQTVARAQRKLFDENTHEPPAHIFYPAVPSFMSVFADLERDMSDAFKYIEEDEDTKPPSPPRPPKPDEPLEIVTSSEASYYGTNAAGEFFSKSTIHAKEIYLEKIGVPAKYAINILVDERSRGETAKNETHTNGSIPLQPMEEAEEMTRQEEKRMVRLMLDKLIGQVALKLVGGSYSMIADGKTTINGRLVRHFKGKKRPALSLEEMKEAIRIVRELDPEPENIDEAE